MDCFRKVSWFISVESVLSSSPGRIWVFILVKNSFKNKQLKFVIVDPERCDVAVVDSNTSVSGLVCCLREDTPLKPRIHPVNELSVFPVYVIISSLIFRIPYESGNPFVPFCDCDTLTEIVLSRGDNAVFSTTDSERLVLFSSLIYWWIFWS